MQLERVRKNHMDVEWHEYTDENGKNTPVINASITEKASIIGRVGDYVFYPVELEHGEFEAL